MVKSIKCNVTARERLPYAAPKRSMPAERISVPQFESATMLNRMLFTCLLCFLSALPARATSVLPLYLDQIIDGAAIAFQGSCIGNRVERDIQSGMIVTYTTFQVQDVLKGQVAPVHTIKQIGGRLAAAAGSIEVRQFEGVPQFEVGESYVVFLYGVSAAGFSSPVGLAQGKFDVLPGPAGQQVSNGRDFKEMTANRPALRLPQSAQTRLDRSQGQVDRLGLDEFKQFVRQHAAVAK